MSYYVLIAAIGWWCLMGGGDALAKAPDTEMLPVPADVYRISDPMDVTMGQQPMAVQSFSTRLTAEQLRVFYTDALTKRGWTIEPLPGMDEFMKHQATVNELVERHRDELERDPETKAKLEQLQAAHPAEWGKHQLHAVRGKEHLIIHSTLQEGGRTLVFINRWRGASMMSAEDVEKGADLPTNPCCSGEAVPAAFRQLPSSVPQYPNARMIGTGAAPTALKSEVYFSSDSPAQITAYYRQHMAYNGWKLAKEDDADHPEIRNMLTGQAASMNASAMTYRSETAYCGIVVAERPKISGVEYAGPREAGATDEPMANERSVIMVTYLAIPSPQRPPVYAPRGVGSRR